MSTEPQSSRWIAAARTSGPAGVPASAGSGEAVGRIIGRAVLALGLTCAFGTAAVAQEAGTGTLIKGRQMSSAPVTTSIPDLGPMEVQLSKTALAMGRQVAACSVRSNERGVESYLTGAGNDDRSKSYDRIRRTVTNCLSSQQGIAGREMSFTDSMMHGLLAEAWFLKNGTSAVRAEPVTVESIRTQLVHDGSPDRVMQTLSWCIAKTRPDETAALLATQPGSAEESQAFVGVGQAIPTCLDRTVTLKTSRTSTRLALASTAFAMGRGDTGSAVPAAKE